MNITLTNAYKPGLTMMLTAAMTASAPANIEDLSTFEVIGSKEAVWDLPGSGAFIEIQNSEDFRYDDINQLLREVPGVYTREEDGYGLFPNISLRGVDPGRSGKVTIMEDGILMAPATYAAPSAYYSPTAGRMAGLEILKGSSQIQYGPHTTGGAINYISTPIPQNQRGYAELSYGSNNDLIGHINYGNRVSKGDQQFGLLLEIYHRQNDGFKTIQPAAGGGYAGSDDTGFDRTDYMAKFMWAPNSDHRFEAKVGYSEMLANETYLGLSEDDFARASTDRYAASRFDNIDTDHWRTYLRHTWSPSTRFEVSTTAYYNKFHRNWYKLDKVNGTTLSQALFNDHPDYPTLVGSTAGSLKVKANNRDYYGQGIQSDAVALFQSDTMSHKLSFGLRLHEDQIRRFQWADIYNQDDTGAIVGDPAFSGPENEGDREQTVTALAAYIRDEIRIGDWQFTPGIRFEWLDWDYFRADSRDPAIEDSGNLNMVAPGISVQYAKHENWTAFASYHRGISPPAPSGLRNGLEEEKADSFEMGARFRGNQGFYAETLLFYTGFQNLITSESVANGGSDANIGEVDSIGVEALAGIDLGELNDWGIATPIYVSATYTDATVINPTDGQTDPESIFYGAEDGNRLPYIPEWQFFASAGLEGDNWATQLRASYVGERFGTGDNALADPTDIRVGKLDSHFILDWSASYRIWDNLTAFVSATNLLDETYVASRLPHGLRPGAPRLFRFGLRMDWY